jgi:hypothetical protein
LHFAEQKKLMMMEKQVMMKKQMEMFQMKQNMMKQAQVLFSFSVAILTYKQSC